MLVCPIVPIIIFVIIYVFLSFYCIIFGICYVVHDYHILLLLYEVCLLLLFSHWGYFYQEGRMSYDPHIMPTYLPNQMATPTIQSRDFRLTDSRYCNQNLTVYSENRLPPPPVLLPRNQVIVYSVTPFAVGNVRC